MTFIFQIESTLVISFTKEYSLHSELESGIGTKVKNLSLTADGEFEIIQLNNNPLSTMKIRASLPTVIRERLVNCLKANADLFAISPP